MPMPAALVAMTHEDGTASLHDVAPLQNDLVIPPCLLPKSSLACRCASALGCRLSCAPRTSTAATTTPTSGRRWWPATSCRCAAAGPGAPALPRLCCPISVLLCCNGCERLPDCWSRNRHANACLSTTVSTAGGAPGAHRALSHGQGQPGGLPAPLHMPGPQARVVSSVAARSDLGLGNRRQEIQPTNTSQVRPSLPSFLYPSRAGHYTRSSF